MFRVSIRIVGGVALASSAAAIGAVIAGRSFQPLSIENEILKYRNEELQNQIQKLQAQVKTLEGKDMAQCSVTDVFNEESARKAADIAKNRKF